MSSLLGDADLQLRSSYRRNPSVPSPYLHVSPPPSESLIPLPLLFRFSPSANPKTFSLPPPHPSTSSWFSSSLNLLPISPHLFPSLLISLLYLFSPPHASSPSFSTSSPSLLTYHASSPSLSPPADECLSHPPKLVL